MKREKEEFELAQRRRDYIKHKVNVQKDNIRKDIHDMNFFFEEIFNQKEVTKMENELKIKQKNGLSLLV